MRRKKEEIVAGSIDYDFRKDPPNYDHQDRTSTMSPIKQISMVFET
jgi:hypothetical protein